MRLLTLAYATADEFLASYHDSDGGTVSVQTRTDGTIGEQLLVEVSFPGLPNRALIRAAVTSLTFEHGLRFVIDPADAVGAAKRVQPVHEVHRVESLAVDRDGDAARQLDHQLDRFGR